MKFLLPVSMTLVSLMTGCAGSLTVNSVPQGALISSNQQALGQAPLVIMLTKNSACRFPQGANGCYMVGVLRLHNPMQNLI